MPVIIHGLLGFSHGWARVLTVMSPEGATAARAHFAAVTLRGAEGAVAENPEPD